MINDNPAAGQSAPHFLSEDIAALDLLDRLAESEPEPLPRWFAEDQLVEILETAERLRSAEEAERGSAPYLAQALERHPETRARLLIANESRFRTWSLAEELIERGRRSIFDNDPYRAVRLTRLAVVVTDHLDTALYPRSLASDLRARAWGGLGNAYRCAGQLRSATSALDRARDLLLEGTGDPLEEGILLGLEGSLQTDYGHYDAAIEVLERACSIYRELDEPLYLARTLIKLVTPLQLDRPGSGLGVAQNAERLLDPERDGELFLLARHNHIAALVDAGKTEQASMLLEASRKYYRQSASPLNQIRLAWTEAQLSAAFGNLEEAEASYEVILDEILRADRRLEGALLALDLAACRLSLGKTQEAIELASTMAETLRGWGAHSRAHEAWALLQQALEVERASVDFVQEVALFIRRSWSNPDLPFSKSLTRKIQAPPGR